MLVIQIYIECFSRWGKKIPKLNEGYEIPLHGKSIFRSSKLHSQKCTYQTWEGNFKLIFKLINLEPNKPL